MTPSLAGLRVVARAITPPGQVRRFHTIFFVAYVLLVVVRMVTAAPKP